MGKDRAKVMPRSWLRWTRIHTSRLTPLPFQPLIHERKTAANWHLLTHCPDLIFLPISPAASLALSYWTQGNLGGSWNRGMRASKKYLEPLLLLSAMLESDMSSWVRNPLRNPGRWRDDGEMGPQKASRSRAGACLPCCVQAVWEHPNYWGLWSLGSLCKNGDPGTSPPGQR